MQRNEMSEKKLGYSELILQYVLSQIDYGVDVAEVVRLVMLYCDAADEEYGPLTES
jgi:hypothetical protein